MLLMRMRMRTILMMSLPLLRLLMLMIFGMLMPMLRPIAAAARHFPWQFYLLVLLFLVVYCSFAFQVLSSCFTNSNTQHERTKES